MGTTLKIALAELTGDTTLGGNIAVDGITRTADAIHLVGGFEGQAEVITLVQNAYSQITNATGNLWTNVEADGFTVLLDKITILKGYHYTGSYAMNFTGSLGRVFRFRLFNETQNIAIGESFGATGRGATDLVPIAATFYAGDVNDNDVIYMQVVSIDGDYNATIRDGHFQMKYIHD